MDISHEQDMPPPGETADSAASTLSSDHIEMAMADLLAPLASATQEITSSSPIVPSPPPKTDKPRPHVCLTCSRCFARLEHLKRHERSHTKEKPFACPECARCFARRDLLLRHQQKLHQTTTPSARPRNRRESTTGAPTAANRVRKNSIVGPSGNPSMRPRANTISHFDHSTKPKFQIDNVESKRTALQTHSRHPSLMGLPMQGIDFPFATTHTSTSHRSIGNGPVKLELQDSDIDMMENGMRTAPLMGIHSGPDFDFPTMMYGANGDTINPNALHYPNDPSAMTMNTMSAFDFEYQDPSTNYPVDDIYDWLPGFDQQLSFAHSNNNNDFAVDESSPSAMSTGSQSGISEMVTETLGHPTSAPPPTSNMWQRPSMAPPQLLHHLPVDPSGNPLLSFPKSILTPPHLSNGMGTSFSTTPVSVASAAPESASFVFPAALELKELDTSAGQALDTPDFLNGTHYGDSFLATITDSTRNAILGAFNVATSQQRLADDAMPNSRPESANLAANEGKLPIATELRRFIAAYIGTMHSHLPFLHLPTLSFDPIAQKGYAQDQAVAKPVTLALCLSALGARQVCEHQAAERLSQLAVNMVAHYLSQYRHSETPLWLCQSVLLNVIYDQVCGAAEKGKNSCAIMVNLARRARILAPMEGMDLSRNTSNGLPPGLSQCEPITSDAWLRWRFMEERKRTLFAIYLTSSVIVSGFDQMPALTNSEIGWDLPCHESLYSAEDHDTFRSIGGLALVVNSRLPFRVALQNLLSANERRYGPEARRLGVTNDAPGSNLQPSSFGCLILINALHKYIWDTRQRHAEKSWTTGEIDMLHQHIEPALQAWRAAWSNDPQHSPQRPNPYGQGPLSADAVPLLDLAYVRLYVDLTSPTYALGQQASISSAREAVLGLHSDQGTQQKSSSTLFVQGNGSQDADPAFAKHLQTAASVAADSLLTANVVGLWAVNGQGGDLTLPSATSAFECVQVLAEWVARLQDSVGPYLGILGQEGAESNGEASTTLLQAEERVLLGKISDLVPAFKPASDGESGESISQANVPRSVAPYVGFAARLLHVVAQNLGESLPWPVVRMMSEGLEILAAGMDERAKQSIPQRA